MFQTWQDSKGERYRAVVDDNVAPFVEALGEDNAALLFVTLGGATVYVPGYRTNVDSLLSQLLTPDVAVQLGHHLGRGMIRIPLANAYLVRYYRSRDWSIQDISRKVRLADVTTRRLLYGDIVAKIRRAA